jgi:quercetin dioxygenase-like cupin family protein
MASFYNSSLFSQVQVSKEPLHRLVIENQFIRLLDVWIEPGDTTQFHIHSTPSFFTQFTDRTLSSQIKGQEWVQENSKAGNAWYKPFSPDKLVHRVTNTDTASFHVIDIELLKAYDANQSIPDVAMSLPLLFENEKVYGYKVTDASLLIPDMIGRGPMVTELISGGPMGLHNLFSGETEMIKAGQFLFIEPNTYFHFTSESSAPIEMVICELK